MTLEQIRPNQFDLTLLQAGSGGFLDSLSRRRIITGGAF